MTAIKVIVQIFKDEAEAKKCLRQSGLADETRNLRDSITYPTSEIQELCRYVELIGDPQTDPIRIVRVVQLTLVDTEACVRFTQQQAPFSGVGKPFSFGSILPED